MPNAPTHRTHEPAPLDAALVWFRRDLRAHDHAALYHALRSARRVWCAFVFDRDILDPLLERGLAADRRVEFIHASLAPLDEALAALGRAHGHDGVRLLVRHGHAVAEIDRLARELHVQAVYANHDDEPAALQRDAQVRGLLARHGIALHTSKDHVVFERKEVLSAAGAPYSVFTPYRNAWLKKLEPFFLEAYPVEKHAAALAPVPEGIATGMPTLESLGFQHTNLHELKIPVGWPGARTLLEDFLPRMADYDRTRDFPAVKGPSYLSVHLRFGTCSIRTLAREAWARQQAGSEGARVWLSELVWRDFYHQILHHHPHVVGHAFKPEYDRVAFERGIRELIRHVSHAHFGRVLEPGEWRAPDGLLEVRLQRGRDGGGTGLRVDAGLAPAFFVVVVHGHEVERETKDAGELSRPRERAFGEFGLIEGDENSGQRNLLGHRHQLTPVSQGSLSHLNHTRTTNETHRGRDGAPAGRVAPLASRVQAEK